MAAMDTQHLSELVEVADVAVRVASQLRQAKSLGRSGDKECLQRGIEFLERAKKGGVFMSGQGIAHLGFDGALKPLNWAVDTYLLTRAEPRTEAVDYEKVAEYLERIAGCLRVLAEEPKNCDSASLTQAESFFETMGEVLGSRADQMMRREPLEFVLQT